MIEHSTLDNVPGCLTPNCMPELPKCVLFVKITLRKRPVGLCPPTYMKHVNNTNKMSYQILVLNIYYLTCFYVYNTGCWQYYVWPWPGQLFRSAGLRQPHQWMNISGVWIQYLRSQFISLNHGFTVSCVYHRCIRKEGEALDGWWGLYPLERHARVTMPVNWLDITYYLPK